MRHSIRSHPAQHSDRPSRLNVGPNGEIPQKRRERAVLVAVLLPNTQADLADPLAELAALAESAGVDVVDELVQKRMHLTAAYALGKGKLADLKELVELKEADCVIFDNDLAPRQIRGLEEGVGRKVIDRSELILDIFASRAKTREAQLQVELAQLEYTAPRLRGMWTHLERITGAGGAGAVGAVGGVGTRGPGERQIEIDRRIVRERIGRLKREIREIDLRKQREVKQRGDQFTISLVGYTNSGKSTLMNKLTGSDRYAADQLFATLDTKTVRWDLGDGRTALLSDTVGFVRDIPHHLVASFRATLEEAIHAHVLLHVVDISSPRAWQQMKTVDDVLAELGCADVPQITLLNKVDIADGTSIAEMWASHRPDVMRVSALTGAGLDRLVELMRERVQGLATDVTIHVPHADGKLLNEIARLAEIRDRRYGADGVEIDARISRSHLAQLRGRHRSLSVVSADPAPVSDPHPGEIA